MKSVKCYIPSPETPLIRSLSSNKLYQTSGSDSPTKKTDDDKHKPLSATVSNAVPRQQVLITLSFLYQMPREMNSRVRPRDRPQLPDDLPKRMLFRKHIEQISPSAYHILYPLRIQIMRESHPIVVAIRFHLEHKLAYAPETETAMPTRVGQ